MFKIRRNDIVKVIKGRDRGKSGKVLAVYPSQGRALVEGINMVKKHKRRTRENEQGGIISIERPISISNLMLMCKSCNRAVRVGFKLLADKSKARFCKSCGEVI